MRNRSKPSVLTIAGFDPTGGAGILTDSAVFRSMGFHPLAVLTSVAAQGASEVGDVHPLPGSFIRRELEIIWREFQPSSAKIGMLFQAEAVEVISSFLEETGIEAVLDPVIKASSGGELVQANAIPEIEEGLIPRCAMVTPNLSEAGFFLKRTIADIRQAEQAVAELCERWNCAVLLKGGHFRDDPVDILAKDGVCKTFPHRRLAEGKNPRGTGCALSAAIAGSLAGGKSVEEAVEFGIKFVEDALEAGYHSGVESGVVFLESHG